MTELSAPTVVSLFSGAGGLDIGLERAGFRTVSATDFSSDSMETLRLSQEKAIPISERSGHFLEGTELLEADVRDLKRSDLVSSDLGKDWRPDLLVGGPPCQPWSSAGSQLGLSDPRGQLIAHMIRLIGEVRPKFVIFENVQGLVTARGETGTPGEVLRSIQRDLEAVGYASRVTIINAADFGAAQRRVRLILVASELYELPEFPKPTHGKIPAEEILPWVSLGELLRTLPQGPIEPDVRPTGERAELLRALTPGTGIRTGGRIMNNRPGGHWGYRQDSFLADLSLPSRTIRAASTPDWIRLADGDMRRLSTRECAALQGFPVDWQFFGPLASRFRQIGNAVQVDVAKALGETIRSRIASQTLSETPKSPPWPSALERRVRYTEAEHRTNGELRVRKHGVLAQL